MGYRIDYDKVIRQADSIARNADDLAKQINQVNVLEQDFRSSWKGQASDTFISRLQTLRTEMSRTRTQMSNLASTIRYCAEGIQREDDAARRRAEAL
jgi:WXG100 family type VII secretion target